MRKGLFVLYGANSGAVTAFNPMDLANNGSLYFTRPRLADYVADAESIALRAQRIFGGLIDNSLRIDVAGTHDFDNLGEAHRALEERRSVGKSILRVDPTVL